MGKFLITLSGARPEVLAQCPTERTKFQSLGWAILITSGMAVISMWFALTSVMGFNPVLSFPVAVIWGLVIMGIDRWLVTSMPADGSRRVLMALPRLVLALLLGAIISTPIVLRIFQSEINNQVSIIKEQAEANFLNSQQHSAIAARVSKWQKDVQNLQNVIDSHGAQAINPASDKEVQGLTTQLDNERKTERQDYHAWQCQLYGGCGAPKGNGPLAAASKARYESDKNQVATLTNEIQAREKQLRDTSAAAQASRLRQAKSALPGAQAQLKAARAEENKLLDNFQATNNATNGLLIRLKALDQLSAGNSTLNAARLLLFLLFLVIECLPVTVKLLQRPGNYEKIFAAVAKREFNAAHRAIYEDRVYGQPGEDAGFRGDRGSWQEHGAFSPGPDAEPPGGYDREPPGGYDRWRAGRDSVDTEFDRIWRSGFSATKTMPTDDWMATAPSGAGGSAAGGSPGADSPEDEPAAGRTPDEEAMDDARDPRDAGWSSAASGQSRRGGFEQHYDDEDL
ncbi:MAG: DUF4407 domain-containing protein [Nocardiopsaceae bacterium]|nr:DUF4407 domain-containing protein [Nocardiopsaceae bacterium]